jgi:hypothetical protein
VGQAALFSVGPALLPVVPQPLPPGRYLQNCDGKHVVSALKTDDDRSAPGQGCMQGIPKCFASSYDEIERHVNLFSEGLFCLEMNLILFSKYFI